MAKEIMNANEIVVRAEQTPGKVSFYNFAELKNYIEEGLTVYKNTVYTPDNLDQAERDLKDLKTIKKKIADKKKELESAYSMPIEEVKNQLDELLGMIKAPMDIIDKMIKENTKLAKKKEIMEYAGRQAKVLGEYANNVLGSEAFFCERWLNATYKTSAWKEDVDKKINDACAAIATIHEVGGANVGALLGFYFNNLSLDGAKQFMQLANRDVAPAREPAQPVQPTPQEAPVPQEPVEELAPVGYKVIKIYGTERQMLQFMTQLDFSNLEYEEIEDGMPKAMFELVDPSFDSFVAFDIEHTGTFGIHNGDTESEITEIGAVKVIHGRVVERFDMLANPGRRIVPRVARLTGITEAMVANQPPVAEVIKAFKAFVGNNILVGHNIKACDIPHITKAARKAGINFDNSYFDTKNLAKKFKAKNSWESISLPALAEYYGIEQKDAHRASCDAETNAYVYLKLMKE